MLHILYGTDEFRLWENLEHLKGLIEPPELLDANLTQVQASSISLQNLEALCNTVPFMSTRRMVILEGLLTLFQDGRVARRTRRAPAGSSSSWFSIDQYIPNMPDSTDLVLVDNGVDMKSIRNNVLLAKLSSFGDVKEFPILVGNRLNLWIENRAAEIGCKISRAGLKVLVDLVGGNLRTMTSEIEKLSLYCGARAVEEEDVRLLVSSSREVLIYEAVDNMLDAHYSRAMQVMGHLLKDGESGVSIVRTVAFQVSLLIVARDMIDRRVSQEHMSRRLGRPNWVVNKITHQSRRHSVTVLESLYNGLLGADRAIKSGGLAESNVGEYLVEVFTEVLSRSKKGEA